MSNYTWDPIYELAQVVHGATTTESYSCDGAGNRLSLLGMSRYNYNPSNDLSSTPSGSHTTRYMQSRNVDEPLSEVRSCTTRLLRTGRAGGDYWTGVAKCNQRSENGLN